MDELAQDLQRLYFTARSRMAHYPWSSEQERWAELVFCLLDRIHPNHDRAVRSAVRILLQLRLLDVEKLVAMRRPTEEHPFVLTYVLRQHGFDEKEAAHSVQLLMNTARVVQEHFDGKMQRFLRQHGTAMRDELTGLFGDLELDSQELRYAIALWLQNALFMPIPLEHESLVAFLERKNVDLEELLEASDEIGLNIAFVNRLLAANGAVSGAALAMHDESEARE